MSRRWLLAYVLIYLAFFAFYLFAYATGKGCVIEPITGLCTRPDPLVVGGITAPLFGVGLYLLWRDERYGKEEGRKEPE